LAQAVYSSYPVDVERVKVRIDRVGMNFEEASDFHG
jgi:hypothetical protein